jgi:hypothetical protein
MQDYGTISSQNFVTEKRAEFQKISSWHLIQKFTSAAHFGT